MASLENKKIAFLTANEGVEHSELMTPWQSVLQAGGEPVLIAPEVGKVQTMEHMDKSETFEATMATADADAAEFDAVVLPGGVANPDQLRTDGPAIAFLQAMAEGGKPFGVICHGPWTLVEADLVRHRTITSWPSLRTDIRNAGGNWVDEEVQVCTEGPMVLVTSRKPDDLPSFCVTIVEQFARAGS